MYNKVKFTKSGDIIFLPRFNITVYSSVQNEAATDCFYINGACPPGGAKIMTKPVLRSVNGKNLVFAVSDSLKAHEGVASPSHELCRSIKKYHDNLANANIDQLDAVMRDFVTDLNGELSVIASASSYKDYASSFSMLTVNNGIGTITNVGNTCAFLMRDGELLRLSGKESPAKKFHNAIAPVNGKLIGNFPSGAAVVPELSDSYEITKNDVFLLCTDGLLKALTEQRISYILSLDLSDERLAMRLISEALARGADDDITVMIIRNGAPPYSSPKNTKTALSLTLGAIVLAIMMAFITVGIQSCSKKPEISHEGDVITETHSPAPTEFMSSENNAEGDAEEDEFILRTPKPE